MAVPKRIKSYSSKKLNYKFYYKNLLYVYTNLEVNNIYLYKNNFIIYFFKLYNLFLKKFNFSYSFFINNLKKNLLNYFTLYNFLSKINKNFIEQKFIKNQELYTKLSLLKNIFFINYLIQKNYKNVISHTLVNITKK